MSTTATSQYEFRLEIKDAKGPINTLAFSKDGKLLAAGGDDGNVRVYNTENYVCEQVLHSPKWGQVSTLTWLCVEPPVDEKAISLCVGAGRGVISLCPMSKTSTWLVWRDSQTVSAFDFNDAVEAQAYDPLNCRLAVGSHSGGIKVFNVEKCINLTPLWSASMGNAITRGLEFFGGANQFLLSLALETGEMVCRDAQTSNIQWRKMLPGAVGDAALSPDESTLIVDNLTTGAFDIYRFPASTPASTLPFVSMRRYVKQCVFAEGGKVAITGSDHGKVYITDIETGDCIQALSTNSEFELLQAVAGAALEGRRHVIAGGSTTANAKLRIWEKCPPIVVQPTVGARSGSRSETTSRQGMINVLIILLLIIATFPNWAPSLPKPVPEVSPLVSVAPVPAAFVGKQLRDHQSPTAPDGHMHAAVVAGHGSAAPTQLAAVLEEISSQQAAWDNIERLALTAVVPEHVKTPGHSSQASSKSLEEDTSAPPL